jgi:hypothetical protein
MVIGVESIAWQGKKGEFMQVNGLNNDPIQSIQKPFC